MDDPVTIRVQTPPSATVTAVPYREILAHPEQFYQAADIVWVMMSSAMVFLMVPSLSLIYAALSNRSFAMTMFRLPLVTAALVSLEWVLWGYTLTFTNGDSISGWYGGETRANGFADVLARPIPVGNGDNPPLIPELLFVLYEGMFAAFTASVVCGGIVHRAKPIRFLVFITFWSILVYCPIARWTWYRKGWSNQLGVMDFAGGTPVHITSGTTVAAFAIFYDFEISGQNVFKYTWDMLCRIGKRIVHNVTVCFIVAVGCLRLPFVAMKCVEWKDVNWDDFPVDETPDSGLFQPYNNTYLVLGTAILWFGWAGFNGGSALGGNLRAVSAWLSTHVAASAGGVVGMAWQWNEKFWETVEEEGRDLTKMSDEDRYSELTVISFCDGAVAGLVAITPGSGYVPVWSAAIFGAVAATFVGLIKRESNVLLRHDKLHVFAIHAGAGLVGMCLTGLFADSVTIGLDGHSTLPNPDYSRGRRLGYQIADALAATGYTFTMTILILNFMKFSVFVLRYPLEKTFRLRDATGFLQPNGEPRIFVDDFQPTPPQRWRFDPILLQEVPQPASQPAAQPVTATTPNGAVVEP
ncbi:Rh-like protein/ammonium transporter [Echria macrotheca]|uniref:Rh-like protein/ammonium transporter n=1 Tax=Echria macrotheca TaxID=438768 RepID=A0AAJ0B4A0_9PEZI|nr:Rh-like protein/ammonium transporter [Echria macrotheca]